jgi:hypothetical protein
MHCVSASCECEPSIASSSDTDDQLHTRVESPSCWIAVLPACTAQTYAFFYCASRMPESLSKLHAESATQLVLQITVFG